MTRRANIVTSLPYFELACGHVACPVRRPEDARAYVAAQPRRADGWYAARLCGTCGRPRAVVRVHYGSEDLGLARPPAEVWERLQRPLVQRRPPLRESARAAIRSEVAGLTGEWEETHEGSQILFHERTPVRGLPRGTREWCIDALDVLP